MATKQEIKAYPTRTNQIPRHIPPPHWASHPAVLYLAAGLLPFGTIFVELYFAMTSIWQVHSVPNPSDQTLTVGCMQLWSFCDCYVHTYEPCLTYKYGQRAISASMLTRRMCRGTSTTFLGSVSWWAC